MIATGIGSAGAALMAKAKDVQGRSLWVDAWHRLLRNRAAVVSIVILAVIALMAVFAPLLSQYGYRDTDYGAISCAPNWWNDPACATPAARIGSAPTMSGATSSCASSTARACR